MFESWHFSLLVVLLCFPSFVLAQETGTSSSQPISSLAIIGIFIGSVLLAICLGFLVRYYCIYSQRKHKEEERHNANLLEYDSFVHVQTDPNHVHRVRGSLMEGSASPVYLPHNQENAEEVETITRGGDDDVDDDDDDDDEMEGEGEIIIVRPQQNQINSHTGERDAIYRRVKNAPHYQYHAHKHVKARKNSSTSSHLHQDSFEKEGEVGTLDTKQVAQDKSPKLIITNLSSGGKNTRGEDATSIDYTVGNVKKIEGVEVRNGHALRAPRSQAKKVLSSDSEDEVLFELVQRALLETENNAVSSSSLVVPTESPHNRSRKSSGSGPMLEKRFSITTTNVTVASSSYPLMKLANLTNDGYFDDIGGTELSSPASGPPTRNVSFRMDDGQMETLHELPLELSSTNSKENVSGGEEEKKTLTQPRDENSHPFPKSNKNEAGVFLYSRSPKKPPSYARALEISEEKQLRTNKLYSQHHSSSNPPKSQFTPILPTSLQHSSNKISSGSTSKRGMYGLKDIPISQEWQQGDQLQRMKLAQLDSNYTIFGIPEINTVQFLVNKVTNWGLAVQTALEEEGKERERIDQYKENAQRKLFEEILRDDSDAGQSVYAQKVEDDDYFIEV